MAVATVDEYLANLEGELHDVAVAARRLILDELPEVQEAIKWSQPTYQLAGQQLAYLKAATKHVTFGFARGRELDDPDGVLEGSGTKMAHVKLMAPADLDEELLRGWLRQAADLARG